MNIQTSRFGEVDVPEEFIVVFPSGLVGLPHYTRYVVFDVEGNSVYQWLQSLEDPTLAFVIVQAEVLQPDFHAHVSEESVMDLAITQDDTVSVSVIVTIPHNHPDHATANMRAPIVVNLRTRVAKQIILHESIPLQVPLYGQEQGAAEHAPACAQVSVRP